MSRVYAIEVRDTPFYRECGVDRFRVLRQEGVADRYQIKIYLDGRDLYYVSTRNILAAATSPSSRNR